MCGVCGGGWGRGSGVPGLSLIVERALLPGHGLNGARHGGRLQRGRSVRMEGVAEGVDGGEGPLGSQGESVLVLRLRGTDGDEVKGREKKQAVSV